MIGKCFVAGTTMMLLAGCASTTQFGSGNVNAQVENEIYVLNLEMNQYAKAGMFSGEIRNDVSLYVNGVRSVRGPLHRDGSGHLQGHYQGKPVSLDCLKPHAFTNTRCDVHIEGRKVETLTLTPGAR